MAAGGQAADEDAGVGRVLLHAHAIAEQRPTRERAGRIDREDPDAPPASAPLPGQAVDQGALAGAGRPGETDEARVTRVRVQGRDEREGQGGLVLDVRDGARHRPHVAGTHASREVGGVHASSCRAMTRRCTSLVPSPMVRSLTSRKYFSAG